MAIRFNEILERDHAIHIRYAKERLQAGVSAGDLKDEMLKLYRESNGFFMWSYYGQTPTQHPTAKNELVFRNLIKRAQSELGHTPGQPQQQQQPRRDDTGDDWDARLQRIRRSSAVDDEQPRQPQPAPKQQASSGDDWESRLASIRSYARSANV